MRKARRAVKIEDRRRGDRAFDFRYCIAYAVPVTEYPAWETVSRSGESRKLVGLSGSRRFRELLLQAADELDQALDLVVGQFAFELRHLVLAFLGDLDQVGV